MIIESINRITGTATLTFDRFEVRLLRRLATKYCEEADKDEKEQFWLLESSLRAVDCIFKDGNLVRYTSFEIGRNKKDGEV